MGFIGFKIFELLRTYSSFGCDVEPMGYTKPVVCILGRRAYRKRGAICISAFCLLPAALNPKPLQAQIAQHGRTAKVVCWACAWPGGCWAEPVQPLRLT